MRLQIIFSILLSLYSIFVGLPIANAVDDSGEWVSFKSAPINEDPILLIGYQYKPDGQGSFPAMVVLHSCGGIDYHLGCI